MAEELEGGGLADALDGDELAAEAAAEATAECPLPLSHDRIAEAHWFLHQMLEHYHHPVLFRFSTNAFLSALKSATVMLRLDLERLGKNDWRKERMEPVQNDPLFAAFARGRDVVLHQSSLINGSRVELGLFKYDRLKLAIQQDLKTDEPSHHLLDRIVSANTKSELFVPVHHPWIGEQLGVRRTYSEPKLSTELDVVTASDQAWRIVHDAVRDAHQLLGFSFDEAGDETHMHDVGRVDKFLETDADPNLIAEWGWE